MSNWKPMLAGTIPYEDGKFDFAKVCFPVIASPKLDGIRATVQDKLMSRSLKPISNRHCQEQFATPELQGLDGELIFGYPTAKDAFNVTTSAVARTLGSPDVTYWVFDFYAPGVPNSERIKIAEAKVKACNRPNVRMVLQHVCMDREELMNFEEKCLAMGFEGVMVRSLRGGYKEGRSTLNEGILLKMKRLDPGEAIIVGFEQGMHNANAAMINERGNTARSSSKDGMVPVETLGALIVRDVKTKVEFNIGTGFDQATAKKIWGDKGSYVGQIVKYKSQTVGAKDKPRLPVFLGFRAWFDMDALA